MQSMRIEAPVRIGVLASMALIAGVALTTLSSVGCTQQRAQPQVTAERERDADVSLAGDEQPAHGSRRVVVTKHGPRP
jgi:hypothetical protein